MRSHEFAEKLLRLPDKQLVFVEGKGDGYTHDTQVASEPWWHIQFGQIRVMVSDNSITCVTKGSC